MKTEKEKIMDKLNDKEDRLWEKLHGFLNFNDTGKFDKVVRAIIECEIEAEGLCGE